MSAERIKLESQEAISDKKVQKTLEITFHGKNIQILQLFPFLARLYKNVLPVRSPILDQFQSFNLCF